MFYIILDNKDGTDGLCTDLCDYRAVVLEQIAWVVQHRRLDRHLSIVLSAQIPVASPVTGLPCNLD